MAYTVLARRYRSQTFDEVIGQDPVAQTLKNAITTGRVAHAYLFTGTRGVGKTTMARILAKSLNCLSYDAPTTQPCCRCDSCMAVNAGEDIDVIEIDGASNTGVDNVRELRQNAIYRPARARYKIYIIDEVHMLSPGAFNALLKILEEPPSHVKFIFATTEPHKVPPTVQSRCQRFDFADIPAGQIAEQLKLVLREEKIHFEEDLVLHLAKLAAGSMRDGLSLLDRLISTGIQPLSASMLEEFLGQPSQQKIFNLAARIAQNDAAATLDAAEQLLSAGQSCVQVVLSLMDLMRDLMVVKAAGHTSELLVLTADQREQAAALAEKFDLEALIYNITALEKLRWVVKNSDNPRILLETVLLRLTLSEHFMNVAALLEHFPVSTTVSTSKKDQPSAMQSQPAEPHYAPDTKTSGKNNHTELLKLDPLELIKEWQQIMTAVRARDPALSGRLKDAVPGSFQNGILTLAFPPSATMAKQLCECSNNTEKLQAILGRIVGSPVKVVFSIDPNLESIEPPKHRPPGARTSQKTANAIANDPAVKMLLTDLDARITGVEET
jgi:DNA polymerase-3 subunit gamma/tau